MPKLKEGEKSAKHCKILYDALPEAERTAYENQYEKESEAYKAELEAWKEKYGIEKVPRKSKSKPSNSEPEKVKGGAKKEKKEEKEEKKENTKGNKKD